MLNPQGCGLGLYISNKIVKELGDTFIKVRSEFGKGSIFSFNIDIYEEEINLETHHE